ncbi:putative membrane protein [Clostridium cavendishii DSM 21758]|uniref:Putative membrane protein n=1 Tax=Clostridium cavendishii DSM 21758 TaxID=1121302 RepID=A0A1M6STZ8_9CLOT|nr:YhgE/Pip domain-containing protein [Clostridium cavendishii]SHK48201.1 putative membrane protein [Clostridium cavendishii DSM 21758]
MKFAKIAKKDISGIFHNRFIRVSVVAIIIVPLLYSLLYLAAFWDPYSRMDKLPVAVVNLDKGANNDGKYENAGSQLVDELKSNTEVGWRFANLEDAKKGVEGEKYYSMFVIPEDFSAKILSAKDGKPEQPKIQYIPNEKKNFLAAQIGGKVEDKLKEKITAKVVKQYTEATFDKLFDVKDGMLKASDGSKELADGNKEMLDGVTKLTDGIPTMQDGVSKLHDGSVQVKNGFGTFKSKIDGGVSAINGVDFSKILNSNNLHMAQNAIGETQKIAGMDTSMLDLINKDNLNFGKKTYGDVNSILASNEFNTILGKPSINTLLNMDLSNPQNKVILDTRVANAQKLIADGVALQTQLSQLEKQMPKELVQLAGSEDLLKAKFSEIKNTIATINTMAAGINNIDSQMKQVNDLMNYADTLNKNAKSLTQNIVNDDNYKNLITSLAKKPDLVQTQQVLKTLDSLSKNPNLTPEEQNNVKIAKGTIEEQGKTLASVSGLYTKYSSDVTNLINGANYLNGNISGMKTQLDGLNQKLSQVKQFMSNNQALLTKVNAMLNDDNAKAISQTVNMANNIKVDLAKNGENLDLLKDLAMSTKDMQALVPKISVVKNDLDAAKPLMDKLNTPQNLALIEKSPELAAKLKQVQSEIKDSQDLMRMANEKLTEGNLEKAQSLVASIPTLKDGVAKLYDGTVQLSDGLGTLNGKMPELADGGNKLKDGATKLADGSKELSDKLNDGYTEMNDGLKNSSSDMGTFVSEPFTMNNEALNAVKDYGTGFTPYFIPLSLWVGAIMMFFVISPKVEDEMGAGPKSKVAGKYLSYGFIGLLQSVLVSAVVLTLGLKPNNIVMYFVFNILMSYTFIAIIQCLISLLGDAGRLIAIVLLILQLTSCAGTFPLEVVPDLFKFLNPFMPFTYGVAGLREAISGSDISVIVQSAFVLACIGIVSLVISMIFQEKGELLQQKVEAKKEQAA